MSQHNLGATRHAPATVGADLCVCPATQESG